MNEKELKHFEEILVKAVQSGKKETSNLVSDIRNDFSSFSSTTNAFIKEATQKLIDHEDRIRKNDAWRIGITAIMSFLTLFGAGILWLLSFWLDATINSYTQTSEERLKAQIIEIESTIEDIPELIEEYYQVSIESNE